MPSKLAKRIGAIFLPADWRQLRPSDLTRLEMIDKILSEVAAPTDEVKQRARAAADEIGRLFGRPFNSDSKKIVAIIVRHLTGDQQGEKEDS